jgi:hypothetical protein
VADTRQMANSCSLAAQALLPPSSPTSIAPGPVGDCRCAGDSFLRDLKRGIAGDRDRKHRRLVLFQLKLDKQLRHDSSDSCHHEFDRVRLLKTFGSRSEKTLPRGFRPATAKTPR